jgi:hypothetical protein
MLVGHFAAGIAAKRVKPDVPLGSLVLAAMLADLLWLAFMAAGIESIEVRPGRGIDAMAAANIPYSHSLLMIVIWGAALAFWVRRGWIVFAVAASHWVLDWIAHPPRDLLLAPGSHRYFGLGLWTSVPAAIAIEGGMWVAAIVIYLRSTKARSRSGVWGFWVMAALLTLLWLANLNSGPTKPNVIAESISFVMFGLFILWAYWMDRVRVSTANATPP